MACLYGLGVLGLLGPSPPAKSKSNTKRHLSQLRRLKLTFIDYATGQLHPSKAIENVFIRERTPGNHLLALDTAQTWEIQHHELISRFFPVLNKLNKNTLYERINTVIQINGDYAVSNFDFFPHQYENQPNN
jgi:hypothetical protein